MNLLDVISWESTPRELVHKFDTDEVRLGSQLIVYPAQTAFFVRGGQVLDEFASGTYTLKTDNIPLLNKLINVPFNKKTPFKADVWFVNRIAILDCKWGTMTPLQIDDPKYDIIVPMRAYGQYGFKVENPRLLLEYLVGNMPVFETVKIEEYLKGMIVSKMTSIIYEKLRLDGQTILNINAEVDSISEYSSFKLRDDFAKLGLSLELFKIISLTVKEDDPSFRKLKESKDLAARIKIIGKENYRMTRSFDVLEKAAENDSPMGAAVGLGAGLGAGRSISDLAATLNTNPQTPPQIPVSKTYYVYVDGMQKGGQTVNDIIALSQAGKITQETLVWTAGMANWAMISEVNELAATVVAQVPPPLV